MARDNDPDERLQALSEEIARVRRAAEPAQPPERQPSDLERLVAREVTKVLAPTEIVVASDLGYFGRSDDAALVVFLLTVFIGPLAGLLGFAAARHWWVVLTDRRLLVFRLFEAQASFPDSGMALERSAAVPEVTIEKARIGRLGTSCTSASVASVTVFGSRLVRQALEIWRRPSRQRTDREVCRRAVCTPRGLIRCVRPA